MYTDHDMQYENRRLYMYTDQDMQYGNTKKVAIDNQHDNL